MHPIFHVSQLRAHNVDEEDLVWNIPERGPTNMVNHLGK